MLKSALVMLALTAASPAFAVSTLAMVDTDKDGTIDVNEATTAAGAAFDKLDVDHDCTLDAKELKGRISKKDWATADPDKDGTLSKDEYLAYVATLFKAADKDSEGTIDKKELRSADGRKLERLLK
jgi:Ca2+-binding EF-hand superfamily protein